MCSDIGLVAILDKASDLLAAQGHHVTRGPTNVPGEIKHYSPEDRVRFIEGADVAVFSGRHRCTADLMNALPRLRGVCYPVIGVETIDIQAANELGLIIGHGATRGNYVGMAEGNIMLMLMMLYQVQGNIARLRGGEWRAPVPLGRQMEGKTIGLLGFGRIARSIAERLAPFGVRLLTHSPRARAEDLPASVTPVSFEQLLAESDVLSLLTGLTDETRHMMDAAAFAKMKPRAYLINTGRGEICDEAALYEALRDRVIAGAALDTFAIEPLPADSPLRTLDNVILTPHAAGHTREGADEFAPVLVENINRILCDELPRHTKNPEAEPAWRARLALLGPIDI